MNSEVSPGTETRQVAGLDVLIEGTGDRTVVMIHGWPDTAALWAPQVAALRGQMRCVRFTLPGFDRAHERRIYPLEEILAALKEIVDSVSPQQPVTLLLHDWGCLFGYRFAQAHHDRVAAIAALDVGDAGSKAHLAELGLAAKLGMAAYQLCLAGAWHLPAAWGDALTRRIAHWAGAPSDMRQLGAHMNYPYVVQWTRGYGRPTFKPHCPLLFAYGSRKPFMFHSAAWLAALQAVPGNQVLKLRTGHWVSHEGAAEFNAALLQWLALGPQPAAAPA
ncbi:alpha/beta hydrolase [Pelomonas sp. HMWF004]|nr:alpha/beta hydrolase [Pelomonas sp. HMWF004]